jgi:hypothetical protein
MVLGRIAGKRSILQLFGAKFHAKNLAKNKCKTSMSNRLRVQSPEASHKVMYTIIINIRVIYQSVWNIIIYILGLVENFVPKLHPYIFKYIVTTQVYFTIVRQVSKRIFDNYLFRRENEFSSVYKNI